MSQITFSTPTICLSSFAYWYQPVTGISYGLSQSDPIQRRSLHSLYLGRILAGHCNLTEQGKPLNGITLGHRETDNINGMITISE
jgi:hypothetical protein